MTQIDHRWSVPTKLDDVPEQGLKVEIKADQGTLETLAAATGVVAVERLEATFDLSRAGQSRLHVVGTVTARVRQTCVVTLVPLDNDVVERVDLVFVDSSSPLPGASHDISAEDGDPPEPLVDGSVDLGAIATEFFILGVDPYPRKPGAVFEAPRPPGDGAESGPFGALAALRPPKGRPNH